MKEAAFGPGGVVESSVTLYVSTDESEAPYGVGFVRLDDGPRVFVRVVRAETPGARVQLVADPEGNAFWFAAERESDPGPRHAA